ncbi:MAG TPA: isocitrate/isopropylmalate dehydrogenase family protein [Polyangiaceae bacterium]|nr:isocitrate/isopropylmalate dehydrogenase family protein [Polyangiaceae bacterium]
MSTKKIAILPGDGIGVEVTREARQLLELYRERAGLPLELWDLDLGAERYLRDGTTLPADVLEQIRGGCAAVLLGALGDPRVKSNDHARDILFGIRFGCDLYSNIRPVRALSDRLVPIKNKRAADVDFVVFRENTEGLYANIGGHLRKGTPGEVAIDEDINTRHGVERIIVAAFEYAKATKRTRVHMADKSNALRHAHELWLRVFHEVRPRYPGIEGVHMYVDALCLRIVQAPEEFQVIVTNNLFGDIVTDLAAALQGGLGMAASANVHSSDPARVAMFEPVHGSAPPLAGKDLANPFAALATVGMMLAHLGWPSEERRIETAMRRAIETANCTADVGGRLGTRAAGAWVRDEVKRLMQAAG